MCRAHCLSGERTAFFPAVFNSFPGVLNGLLLGVTEVIQPLFAGKAGAQKHVHDLLFSAAE